MKEIKFYLFFLALTAIISSCSFEKRIYRDGFYFEKSKTNLHPIFYHNEKKNQTERSSLHFSENHADIKSIRPVEKQNVNTAVEKAIKIIKIKRDNFFSHDTLQQKHSKKPNDNSQPQKRTEKENWKLILKLALIGLGLALVGYLLAFSVDFNLNGNIGIVLIVLVAVILIGAGIFLLQAMLIVILVMGIIALIKWIKGKSSKQKS
jgi:cation transport ATPase